jgi:hypothetical protein
MSDLNTEILTGGSRNSILNPVLVVNAPIGVGQVRKTFAGIVATSTTLMVPTTLYTVTAGKTFYLTDLAVSNNTANSSAASINSSVVAGVGMIASGHVINTSPFEMTDIGSEPSIAGGLPLVLQLGASSTITSCAYTIYGYEQ